MNPVKKAMHNRPKSWLVAGHNRRRAARESCGGLGGVPLSPVSFSHPQGEPKVYAQSSESVSGRGKHKIDLMLKPMPSSNVCTKAVPSHLLVSVKKIQKPQIPRY